MIPVQSTAEKLAYLPVLHTGTGNSFLSALSRERKPSMFVLCTGRESLEYPCSAWGGVSVYTLAFDMKSIPPYEKFTHLSRLHLSI